MMQSTHTTTPMSTERPNLPTSAYSILLSYVTTPTRQHITLTQKNHLIYLYFLLHYCTYRSYVAQGVVPCNSTSHPSRIIRATPKGSALIVEDLVKSYDQPKKNHSDLFAAVPAKVAVSASKVTRSTSRPSIIGRLFVKLQHTFSTMLGIAVKKPCYIMVLSHKY